MAVILRNNFRRLPIVVGIINGTIEDQYEEKSSYEEQTNEAQPLNDFINFLANSLNARYVIIKLKYNEYAIENNSRVGEVD